MDDTTVPPTTPEEERATHPEPREILRRSGFDRHVTRFSDALDHVHGRNAANRLVATHGSQLWETAVNRAQGHRSHDDPDPGDDRPLYWARLRMAGALRHWKPTFDLDDAGRAELLTRLERYSRGHTRPTLSPRHPKRILLTGFDPFRLDSDIHHSNPSGAIALALDGRTLSTSRGTALIKTMIMPVRWRDFSDGIVETALLPHYTAALRGHDLTVVTLSQGRVDRFDIELHNGAWRDGEADNTNAGHPGTIPIPADTPTITPQPQWRASTLPHTAMTATTGTFPVHANTEVTEIPNGWTTPTVRPHGPTPDSWARAGAGGSYLSNEIAYRATLLRDAVAPHIPAGHIHTPRLSGDEVFSEEEGVLYRSRIMSQLWGLLSFV